MQLRALSNGSTVRPCITWSPKAQQLFLYSPDSKAITVWSKTGEPQSFTFTNSRAQGRAVALSWLPQADKRSTKLLLAEHTGLFDLRLESGDVRGTNRRYFTRMFIQQITPVRGTSLILVAGKHRATLPSTRPVDSQIEHLVIIYDLDDKANKCRLPFRDDITHMKPSRDSRRVLIVTREPPAEPSHTINSTVHVCEIITSIFGARIFMEISPLISSDLADVAFGGAKDEIVYLLKTDGNIEAWGMGGDVTSANDSTELPRLVKLRTDAQYGKCTNFVWCPAVDSTQHATANKDGHIFLWRYGGGTALPTPSPNPRVDSTNPGDMDETMTPILEN
ncbi:hypothetical protein K474DRAFT_1663967 [Panus rudis PR-1116 ss-1]|nr:hypothetical protein K474DRAFT_1663967 [Panus rudis PR-1116 ss-1]